MTGHLNIKASQIHLFKTVPFYYQSREGEFVLYKKSGDIIDNDRAVKNKHPQLFILKKDKDDALKELTSALNANLVKAMESMPETIDILLEAYGQDPGVMGYLSKITTNSPMMEEHTVNVTALVLQYCFFHDFSDADTARLALCALLHDVGTSKLDKTLLETDKRLTDMEFKKFTTHPELGHDMIILNTDFDISVATVALEHHERIDGSGYPHGSKTISQDSQLIGLIDSYEPLTYRNKKFRKAKKPYNSLQIIKEDVLEGKFSKNIFKKFASCLIK